MSDHRSTGGLILLPPAPDACPVCAWKHGPDLPHNAMTLYYGTSFKMQHGRDVTWEDAMEHCTPEIRETWVAELTDLGAMTWKPAPSDDSSPG